MTAGAHALDLSPRRARTLVDRAIELVRRQKLALLLRAWAASGAIGLVCVALYYVERVEGLTAARPLFACLLVAAWGFRCVSLSRLAEALAREQLRAHDVSPTSQTTATILRTSAWVGFELWIACWLIVIALRIEPWLVPALLPTFCTRGAIAPSWLARAALGSEASGFATLKAAIDESEGHRGAGLGAELMLLTGALGLAFNLAAVTVACVSVGQELLGLDLSFVRAFISPRNHFALLVIAAIALTVIDPVRAAIAALIHVDARLSRDGVALRTLVMRCDPRAKARSALLAVSLACLLPTSAAAQETRFDDAPLDEQRGEAPMCDEPCERARDADAEVSREVQRILDGEIFREFPDERPSLGEGGDLGAWFKRFFDWLDDLEEPVEQGDGAGASPLSLPGAGFFAVFALALVALTALWLWPRRTREAADAEADEAGDDPLARPPEAHFDDAERLLHTNLAEALRSLYLATLVGLSRRRRITLTRERTNGQYLLELDDVDERKAFRDLTRIFDAVRYGHQAPSAADFARSRALAEALVNGSPS